MWHVHLLTNEEGWHIPQLHSHQDSPLLVFVQDGGIWKTKYWMSNETRICAKNHAEEIKDNYDMIQRGWKLGFATSQLTQKECSQCKS